MTEREIAGKQKNKFLSSVMASYVSFIITPQSHQSLVIYNAARISVRTDCKSLPPYGCKFALLAKTLSYLCSMAYGCKC